jgi:phospholipid transport system substrate-binding protein
MLQGLEANRAAYKKDPSKVGELVEKFLLPHFDIQYSARLVLGKHWTGATPAQRERFATAFYRTLVDNYGSALAEFTSDRLKVFPTKVEPNADRATVRTEVIRDSGDKVPVSYSLRKTPEGWKAWDVVIEGISYVKSFREDFGAAIDQQGLDAVIERIEKGNIPVAPKGQKK